jgi:hypothetical protein
MAVSAAHKWGQIIGHVLQASLQEVFQQAADRHGLYLDYQRERAARTGPAGKKGKKPGPTKVSWRDRYGNAHDLDYVLERGGAETVVGLPAAFIEVAWRRYTKHSKNKAQEIEGAIIALADTYSHVRPFLGIVLAGEFTERALTQLRSRDFIVAYLSYAEILQAFATVGIDASSGERTPEKEFREKIRRYKALSKEQLEELKRSLLLPQSVDGVPISSPMAEFIAALDASLTRGVQGVSITVLHGQERQWASVAEAIAYVQNYEEKRGGAAPALKYEVHVRYNNGDVIHGVFQQKTEAIHFLQSFA